MPKRFGKYRSRLLRAMARLPPIDRAELRKFQAYLTDAKVLSSDELWSKYGEAYLGRRLTKKQNP